MKRWVAIQFQPFVIFFFIFLLISFFVFNFIFIIIVFLICFIHYMFLYFYPPLLPLCIFYRFRPLCSCVSLSYSTCPYYCVYQSVLVPLSPALSVCLSLVSVISLFWSLYPVCLFTCIWYFPSFSSCVCLFVPFCFSLLLYSSIFPYKLFCVCQYLF